MKPRLRFYSSLMPFLPYLPAFGTLMGIRASFEALDSGPPIAEATYIGFWYSSLGALASLIIGLVPALVCRPWRPS